LASLELGIRKDISARREIKVLVNYTFINDLCNSVVTGGWRSSVGPIVTKMTHYTMLKRKEISFLQLKKGKFSGSTISCVGTAF